MVFITTHWQTIAEIADEVNTKQHFNTGNLVRNFAFYSRHLVLMLCKNEKSWSFRSIGLAREPAIDEFRRN